MIQQTCINNIYNVRISSQSVVSLKTSRKEVKQNIREYEISYHLTFCLKECHVLKCGKTEEEISVVLRDERGTTWIISCPQYFSFCYG